MMFMLLKCLIMLIECWGSTGLHDGVGECEHVTKVESDYELLLMNTELWLGCFSYLNLQLGSHGY